ncbi:hypothetical protein Goarm_000780 [Gossypium armourianum]|uniref:Uncharacterized protein n=1 Tax=Gossypium armourianum TaxID=34283 RepID=A0A7J9KAW8_9ROSI|nr:hypothetical protein [Gossypium armourianum]
MDYWNNGRTQPGRENRWAHHWRRESRAGHSKVAKCL